MTNINIELPPDIHKKLKLKAVSEGKTIEQLLIEVLNKRVKK
jgi:predicted HicB family RNase H-like nuclease